MPSSDVATLFKRHKRDLLGTTSDDTQATSAHTNAHTELHSEGRTNECSEGCCADHANDQTTMHSEKRAQGHAGEPTERNSQPNDAQTEWQSMTEDFEARHLKDPRTFIHDTQLLLSTIEMLQYSETLDRGYGDYHQALTALLLITKAHTGFVAEVVEKPLEAAPKREKSSQSAGHKQASSMQSTVHLVVRAVSEREKSNTHEQNQEYWEFLPDSLYAAIEEGALEKTLKQRSPLFVPYTDELKIPFLNTPKQGAHISIIPLWASASLVGLVCLVKEKEAIASRDVSFVMPLIRSVTNAMHIQQTEKKRSIIDHKLQSREAILRTFIQNNPAAIAMFNHEAKYIARSTQWDQLLCFPIPTDETHLEEGPATGSHGQSESFALPLHRLNQTLQEQLTTALNSRQPATGVNPLSLPKNKKKWIKWTAHPWVTSYGGWGGAIVFIDDITKEIELTRELEETVVALRRSNEKLAQYGYTTAHDLKEPMRTISSFSQLLLQSPNLQSEELQYLDHLVSMAKRMQKLIDGLLTYAQVNDQYNKREAVNLSDLLADIKADLRTFIQEKKAVISTEGTDISLNGTYLTLKTIFQNLIHNGLKFNTSTPPTVHIKASQTAASSIIEVQDNGIGIKAEELPKIFDMFKRGADEHTYPGSGIGLALCQTIVRQQGGEISVVSTPGSGSTFTLNLPHGVPTNQAPGDD